jgi:flavin-dependent dehydrogenase
MARLRDESRGPTILQDGATVLVVGGGPGGTFFAIGLLKRAEQAGRKLNVVIIEKKKELKSGEIAPSACMREGCNYCAGGISPKLTDVLARDGLALPDDILQSEFESLTVHGDWKNIRLPIPEGRKMASVFRGSRPRNRPFRYENFDSYMLEKAAELGATVITGNVHNVRYSDDDKPVATWWTDAAKSKEESLEADFLVLAAGINRTGQTGSNGDPLSQSLREFIPEFRPPKVRKALICELAADDNCLGLMSGELHFIQYGSKSLKVEMSSLMPKAGYITVVMLGQCVDRASPSDNQRIIKEFLELRHIRRLLPGKVDISPLCLCNPNMTVGVASHPYGHRTAVVGDMVFARLYKDGILSAYLTASALADSVLDTGIDKQSLKKRYWPVIKRFRRDTTYGRFVFLLSRVAFGHPILSRMLYQAISTERRTKPHGKRRLANLLWKLASGDDSYARIFASMFHPSALWAILVGGSLVSARNYVTEQLFGLKWKGLMRHPTAIPKEVLDEKHRHFAEFVDIESPGKRLEFESMYSIEIRGSEEGILRQVGKFGDSDREYLRPRMVNIRRTSGRPNEVKSIIQYGLPFRWLDFSIILERILDRRRVIYRVKNGFARGGVLVFEISPVRKGINLLSTYVGFNFPKPRNPIRWIVWRIFKLAFPGFVHNVIWNHSLCSIKHIVEREAWKADQST